MNKLLYVSILITGLFSPLSRSAELTPDRQFNLTLRLEIGGEGGWDLLSLDERHHHLFISRSSHVQVLDTASNKMIEDISGTDGVHGIAVADDMNLGFTSNGKSNSVSVFDLTTLKVITTVQISGLNPDAIIYEPTSKHVFVFNGRSSNVAVIDTATLKEVAVIDLPGKPELAVSDLDGNVYVNIEDKNEITVIDGRINQVIKHYSLGNGTEPTGLAIDKNNRRLFSVCANHRMVVLDATTGEILGELPIGSGPDSAAFDPKLALVFSSNGEGTLTVVKENNPRSFSVLQNLETVKGARTMAYDETNNIAYLVTAEFGGTPAATPDNPKPRPQLIPNTFAVLLISQH
jgi:YVTN family beta-propeller protein